MDSKDLAYYSGIGIVVATHIYMLNAMMPESMRQGHATLNLVGAGLIIYSQT
jgi:hypothetical protein